MVVWIEEGLTFEHGADDGEEPVGDRAQRPAVGVAAGPERGVSVAAGGIVLDGDAGPVVGPGVDPSVAGGSPIGYNRSALFGVDGFHKGHVGPAVWAQIEAHSVWTLSANWTFERHYTWGGANM